MHHLTDIPRVHGIIFKTEILITELNLNTELSSTMTVIVDEMVPCRWNKLERLMSFDSRLNLRSIVLGELIKINSFGFLKKFHESEIIQLLEYPSNLASWLCVAIGVICTSAFI